MFSFSFYLLFISLISVCINGSDIKDVNSKDTSPSPSPTMLLSLDPENPIHAPIFNPFFGSSNSDLLNSSPTPSFITHETEIPLSKSSAGEGHKQRSASSSPTASPINSPSNAQNTSTFSFFLTPDKSKTDSPLQKKSKTLSSNSNSPVSSSVNRNIIKTSPDNSNINQNQRESTDLHAPLGKIPPAHGDEPLWRLEDRREVSFIVRNSEYNENKQNGKQSATKKKTVKQSRPPSRKFCCFGCLWPK